MHLLSIWLIAAGTADRALGQPYEEMRTCRQTIDKWIADGTAAGNKADYYDNRDGGHSKLQREFFRELKRVEYAAAEVKTRGWGMQTRVLPHVTIGNSSTAGPLGCNSRHCYVIRQMLVVSYLHYTGNNLYVYPEHGDHDARRGDLLPTNTPYLITSQGSSGSDRPFLHAVAFTLGAFHPDVKKRLVQSGLLMPTVQMIFRRSNKNIAGEEEYLTGEAHPSVFRREDLDLTKMIETAHNLEADEIPPLVRLKVIEEELPVQGRDYFESGSRSEVLADTPCVIARIFRGRQYERRMVVSAEGSYDLNDRPLRFRWVVLRGDPDRIQILPKNDRHSVVELRVPYHAKREIRWEPKIHSNRVDIGVFAHNGVHYSAPGFVTYFSLAKERRDYHPDGRIQQIDYTATAYVDPRLTDVKRWRDVYKYAAGGELAGWVRHHERGGVEEFTADGLLVLQKDGAGRPLKTAKVIYRSVPLLYPMFSKRLEAVRADSAAE